MGLLYVNGATSIGHLMPASASFGVVQSFGSRDATVSATLSASPSVATSAGDLLVGLIRDRNTTALAPVSSVTDSAGNAWVRAASVSPSTHADAETWYAASAAALATSQAVTVTVGGPSASTSAVAFTVLDVTGAAASALDVTASTAQGSEIAIGDIGWNGQVTVGSQTAGSATGYTPQSMQVSVITGVTTTQDRSLVPEPWAISGTVTDSVTHVVIFRCNRLLQRRGRHWHGHHGCRRLVHPWGAQRGELHRRCVRLRLLVAEHTGHSGTGGNRHAGLVSTLDGSSAPDFVWVTPNQQDDMHSGSVTAGDNWLKANLDPVLASSWFTTGNAAVIVTMDEHSRDSSGCCGDATGGQVPMVVIAHNATGQGATPTVGDHYGLLRSIEEAYGVGYLGAAGTATNGDVLSLFGANTTTTDSTGGFTVSGVVPGTYTVTASAAGYPSQSAQVSVSSGATTTSDFAL